MPSPVPSELETVTRATLVYDLATIDATMATVAAAARCGELGFLMQWRLLDV